VHSTPTLKLSCTDTAKEEDRVLGYMNEVQYSMKHVRGLDFVRSNRAIEIDRGDGSTTRCRKLTFTSTTRPTAKFFQLNVGKTKAKRAKNSRAAVVGDMLVGSHGSPFDWAAHCLAGPTVEVYIAEADWAEVDHQLEICAAVARENKVPGTMLATVDVHTSLTAEFLRSIEMDLVQQPPYNSFDDLRLRQAVKEAESMDPSTGRYHTTAEFGLIRASHHAIAVTS
jgi:hypothetical protein